MNIVDIGILIILIYQGWMGLYHGFIRIFFELAAFLVGILAGLKYNDAIGVFLELQFNISVTAARLAAFALIWVFIFAFVTILGILISKLINATFLGPLNRIGGLAAGLLKGCLFVLPIILPLIYFNTELANNSYIIQQAMPVLKPLLTEFFRDKFALAGQIFP